MSKSLDDFLNDAQEVKGTKTFELQNSKALKIHLANTLYCRHGSMIAYQGDIKFESTTGGVTKWFKNQLTGEGVPLMKATGRGTLFLADKAADVAIIYLNGDTFYVEGRHLLAFESTVNWDISILKSAGVAANGLFTCKLSGRGFVAITSHGKPIALEAPIVVDPDALLGWTSGTTPKVRTDINLKTFIGKSSGETFQIHFQGAGRVLVQPSETLMP